jgi:hypothetical protein
VWRGFSQRRIRDCAVYRYLENIPGEPFLRLENGTPLATRHIDQWGNSWIVFATRLGISNANNLAETGFYPPLLDRSLRFGLSGLHSITGNWFAGLGQKNPYSRRRISARVLTDDNDFVATWDRQSHVVLPQPGLYTIHPQGEATYRIAADIDTAETDFSYRLPAIPSGKRHRITTIDRAGFIQALGRQGDRTLVYSLWIILGLFLCCEPFLWGRQPKQR